MKKAVFLVALCAILSMGNTSANASLWDFSTIPANGVVSGLPGSTVSWDYRISNNDPINWLVISGLAAGLFVQGVPYDAFDYPIIPPVILPGSIVFGRLYEFTWNATAPVGSTNSGQFTLSAEFWDGDPFGGGNFFSLAGDMSTPYTANAVPVPPSIFLMASGLVGIWYLRRLRKK